MDYELEQDINVMAEQGFIYINGEYVHIDDINNE